MRRHIIPWAAAAILFALGVFLIIYPAKPQAVSVIPPGPPTYITPENHYTNMTTDTTLTVKSIYGILHTVCIGTAAAGETVTIYDNTSGSGTTIATLTVAAGDEGKCLLLDVVFSTGLTVTTGTAAGNITFTWQ